LGIGSTFSFVIVPFKERINSGSKEDIEDDGGNISEDTPLIHKPLNTKGRNDKPSLKPGSKKGIKRTFLKKENKMSRSGKFERYPENLPIKKSKSFAHKTDFSKKMIRLLVKTCNSIKKSFSKDDAASREEKPNDKRAILLKREINQIQKVKEILGQTIKRDIRTIKSNIIRSKKDIFIPTVDTKILNIRFKEIPSARIKNVRNKLLSFHKDSETFTGFNKERNDIGSFQQDRSEIKENKQKRCSCKITFINKLHSNSP
jgi:hypothetical protein